MRRASQKVILDHKVRLLLVDGNVGLYDLPQRVQKEGVMMTLASCHCEVRRVIDAARAGEAPRLSFTDVRHDSRCLICAAPA